MDAYAVLGVEVSASQEQVGQAFRRKAALLHPDKNAGALYEASSEQFKTLNSAYEILKDPHRRSRYDLERALQPILPNLGLSSAMSEMVPPRMAQAFLKPGGRLEEVVLEASIVERLKPNLSSMEHASQAVFSIVETDIPGHKAILVGGTPEVIERGKSQLTAFQKKITGQSAPFGGLIFIVPQDEISRMNLVERLIPNLQKELQAQISHIYPGRIQITGSNQPEVVARLLKWMNNKGSVLLSIPGHCGDCELDMWMYQHHCEVQKIQCGELIRDQSPDKPTVLRLLRFALNLRQSATIEPLIPLCVQVLKASFVLTRPLLRAMSSDAASHEFVSLSVAEQAPLLCTLASTQSVKARHISFASDALVNTLQSVLQFLQSEDGAFLRSRGILAAKEAVEADWQWHPWDKVLRKESMLRYWQLLVKRSSASGGAQLPVEWNLPEVWQMLLKDEDIEMSLTKGMMIKKGQPPPSVPEECVVHTTLVEEVEDVMYELMQSGLASVPLQQIQKCLLERGAQSEVTIDFLRHFCVTDRASPASFMLSSSSCTRARHRAAQTLRKQLSASELRIARAATQFLSCHVGPLQLPSAFSTSELCGLFITWSETCENVENATAVLQQLAKLPPGQLIAEMLPFNVVQLMQGVISFQKAAGTKNKPLSTDLLMMLMNAASADIFAEEGSSAALDVATQYLQEATIRPFFGLSWKDRPMLPMSTSRRIIKELTPEEENLCPACLSVSYSSLPEFANLCLLLANYYTHARNNLVHEDTQKVVEAFTLLAASCQRFCSEISTQSPLGLRRLVNTFATLAKLESADSLVSVGKSGLLNLHPILIRGLPCKTRPKDHWDFGKLAAVAAAYRGSRELFVHIAEAAARMAKKLKDKQRINEESERCFEIVNAFINEGLLFELQKLLQILQESRLLVQKLTEKLHPRKATPWEPAGGKASIETEHILAAWVCAEDPQAQTAALKYIKERDIKVPMMIVMLDNIPKSNVKQLLLDKVLAAVSQGEIPSFGDVQRLLRACQDCSYMSQVQQGFRSKQLLDSVPEDENLQDLLHTLERFLGPINTQMSVPRLESLCAARLMQVLARAEGTKTEEVVKAGLLFTTEALASMPSLVRALRESLTDGAQETGWKDLVKRMDDSCSQAVESKDECLEGWTKQIEDAIVESIVTTMPVDQVETLVGNHKEIEEALGQRWLQIILARSRRVSWTGGGTINVSQKTATGTTRTTSATVRERSRSRSAPGAPSGAPKSKAQKVATPSPEAVNVDRPKGPKAKEDELREWLQLADPSGKLQRYSEALWEHLDGDRENLLEFIREGCEGPSAVERIDPLFWTCINCKQAGHKMLLAKAIIKLHDERS